MSNLSTTNATPVRWTLLPHFYLRQAGFPFAWLDMLADPAITALLDQIATAQETVLQDKNRALQALRQSLRSLYRSSTVSDDPDYSRKRNHLRHLHKSISYERRVEEQMVSRLTNSSTDAYQAVFALYTSEKQLDTLLEHLLHTYDMYFLKTKEQLASLFNTSGDLKLALLMSNEASFRTFDQWLLHAQEKTVNIKHADRDMVHTLVMYLQRFCSKNETSSNFGPFSPGHVQTIGPSVNWNEDRRLEHKVFLSHWAAEALALQMSADPLLFSAIKPRQNPGTVLKGMSLQTMEIASRSPWSLHLGPRLSISTEERDLFLACDGSHNVAEIISRFTEEGTVASEIIIQRLRHLQQMGVLFLKFEVPVGSLLPLADLRMLLSPATTRSQYWFDIIEMFENGLQRFSVADLNQRLHIFSDLKTRFSQIAGISAERGHGRFYSDRAILFEECLRDLDHLTLSGQVLTTIQHELGVFLDFQLLPARYRFTAEQTVVADWFHQTFGPTVRVPLTEYLERFSLENEVIQSGLQHINAELERLSQDIDRTFLAEEDETHERTIDLQDIEQFIDHYAYAVPTLCNPDLLIIAETQQALNAGSFRLLVGDCHALRELVSQSCVGPMMTKQMPTLSMDVSTQYQQLLETDEFIADVIHSHNEKTAIRLSLDCIDIEFFGRSPKPRNRVLPFTHLYVEAANGKLRLSSQDAAGSSHYLRLTTPPTGGASISNDPLAIFGFPRFSTGLALPGIGQTHLPRISSGRMILQREIWRMPIQDLLADLPPLHGHKEIFYQLTHVRAIQKQLGIPRYTFAKISGERKPLFVDFDAPLLVQQLLRLARQHQGMVEFSEMLPGPHDLWLEQPAGKISCELRLALFSTPAQSLS